MILIRSHRATFAFLLVITMVTGLRFRASAQSLTFKIPPLKTSVSIENQPIAIIASGMIAKAPSAPGENIFRVELDADLTDLQKNFTNIFAPSSTRMTAVENASQSSALPSRPRVPRASPSPTCTLKSGSA